jgi:hypothetical protein
LLPMLAVESVGGFRVKIDRVRCPDPAAVFVYHDAADVVGEPDRRRIGVRDAGTVDRQRAQARRLVIGV